VNPNGSRSLKILVGFPSVAAMMSKEVMEDFQLLREYAEHRSERAFTELVHRHMDFVYSTALRLVNESQLAEDVTQMVFIRLGRQASSLRSGTVLTGWLYRTTQFVAQTALRSDWRRRKRESLAMQFSELNRESESVWKEMAPLLEEAMEQLRRADQDAVLLRFFTGKSLREVGDALGISDDTAQKRVNRAIDRMRAYFARRGVVVSAALLGSTLAAHTVQAAPVQLASTLATSATSAAGAALGFTTTIKLFKAMVFAKLEAFSVGVAVAAVLIIGGAVALLQNPAGPVMATNDLSNAVFVLRGRVQTPDGRPLAGAPIHVATPGAMVRLYYLTNSVPTNARVLRTWTTSAADGTFAVGLPAVPREGKAVVTVNDDAGYAAATADELSANSNVIVQPWGRIEGVLRVGKSLGTNQTVNIGIWGSGETYEWSLVSHSMSVKTDANGRFDFPRVAPGDVWLTRTVIVRPGEGRQSGHHYVKLAPGDHLEVTLGGTGCTLTGRVETTSSSNLIFYGSMWASETHGMRPPRNWRHMSTEERRIYTRAWRDSVEGEAFKQEVRNYEFPVRPDGTLRIDDVLPGSYRMQVRTDAPRAKGESARLAAKAEIQIEVPEILGSDESLDIGTLSPGRVSDR
jgi:RNA polymerase sigma factor (sigma-70 family)